MLTHADIRAEFLAERTHPSFVHDCRNRADAVCPSARLKRRIDPAAIELHASREFIEGREAVYLYALAWVDALEPLRASHYETLTLHLWNRRGELLTRLDEVIRAILQEDLCLRKPNDLS